MPFGMLLINGKLSCGKKVQFRPKFNKTNTVAQQANGIISFAWNGDWPTFFANYIGQKLAFQKVNFSATFS
jgi:hypothetical protein